MARSSSNPVSATNDRRKAPQTRARILDAAESLFARNGYYGVSLRDIAAEASVPVALSYYHFGSKEDLFRAVIDRRADENVAGLRHALAEACSAGRPSVEALVRAFIAPVVELALSGDAGWRNYVRLLAHVASLPHQEAFLAPVNEHYDAVVRDFVQALIRAMPEVEGVDVHWGFYFLQATIAHALTEAGVVDRQSDGLCRSSDLRTIVEKMTRFFSAGLRGMAA